MHLTSTALVIVLLAGAAEDPEPKPRKLWPLVPFVLGVMSTGGGGALLLSGNGHAARITAAADGSEALALASQAPLQQNAGAALLLGGLVVAAIGLILYFVL